jgi:urea transport system substrate-binding protein
VGSYLLKDGRELGSIKMSLIDTSVVDPLYEKLRYVPLVDGAGRPLIGVDGQPVTRERLTTVELNNILFYPVRYEGEESERNVFYTGAAPNQQVIPAVGYLMREEKVQRWVLAGTDDTYTRVTNKILEAYLSQNGVNREDVLSNYTAFDQSDLKALAWDIKKFGSTGSKTAVVSSIDVNSSGPFYKELGNAGVTSSNISVMALSVDEEELARIDIKPLIGDLTARNYFQSIETAANRNFITKWHEFTKDPKRPTTDTMEAHVIGFGMWVEAVKRAGTVDPDKVIDAIVGLKVPNLTGGMAEMLPNHHITKPVYIGAVRADGQFDVIWKTQELIPGDAWSEYLEQSKDLIGDWKTLKCGDYNTVTRKCGGSGA